MRIVFEQPTYRAECWVGVSSHVRVSFAAGSCDVNSLTPSGAKNQAGHPCAASWKNRMYNEAIVDARPEEEAMSWYNLRLMR